MTHPTGLLERTNAEYHGGPGISKSRLDQMALGPRIYWNAYVNPNRPPREQKQAWTLGSATHSAILEPDLFPLEFVVMPEYNLRKPSHRDERDHFKAMCEAAGKTVVTPDQYDLALAMRDAVHTHPIAGPMLADLARRGALAEQSYYAVDPETGMLVKCRFDYLLTADGFSLDLKTTRGASPQSFAKSCVDYRYTHQEPWYRHVYQHATGGEALRDWVFLVVESEPPHQVGLYRLPRDVVSGAQVQNMETLRRIADCTAMDVWPDPGYDGVQELQLPRYALSRLPMNDPDQEFSDEE